MYIRYIHVHQLNTRKKGTAAEAEERVDSPDVTKPSGQYCRNNKNSRDSNFVNLSEVLTPSDIS